MKRFALALSCAVFTLVACGDTATAPPDAIDEGRWEQVTWSGGTANLAVLPPSAEAGPGPHPVLFALSWGSGSADLLLGFLDAYWGVVPARRGYYVVGLEGTASGLAQTGDELLPAIFAWMDANLEYDPAKVAAVGASNGGRGVFYAALSQPERFGAIMGLPGMFDGGVQDALKLKDIPVKLYVGEFDTGWVTAAENTVETLTSAGVSVELEVVPEGGHVLFLSPAEMMDWIDEALGR